MVFDADEGEVGVGKLHIADLRDGNAVQVGLPHILCQGRPLALWATYKDHCVLDKGTHMLL